MTLADVTSRGEARDPVEVLAEEFLERHRRGERVRIEEYASRHPDLAGRIEELFPALLALEGAGFEPDPLPRIHEPLQGQLGEYRLLREIGRGGMGVVYEAEQETLGRRVAVKVLLHGAFSDDTELERFRREARAAARLHHTNIVPVFGIGEDGGIHYYAMQFIHGQSLAGVLSEVKRKLPSSGGHPPDYHRNVATLGLQAAEALAYAHGEGILHRDIKPSNLLLDTRSFLWVTDFGLAKMGDSGELTARGSVVGTLRYMAPERLQGAEDARSDIYSLGATLYEALTLEPPFGSTDRARLIQDLASREPLAPRRIDSSIPRDLETVVLRAMAKDPRDRYASALELAEDLRRFIAGEPVMARPALAPERLWRWCRRNPAVAVLSAATGILLAALAAGGMLSAKTFREQRDAAFGLLVASKLEEGRAWQRSGALGQRMRSLAAFGEASAAGSPDLALRNEVIGSLVLPDMALEGTWEMPESGIFHDERLERSATHGPGGSILVREGWPPGATMAVLRPRRGPARDMLFSPGSRFLATFHPGGEGTVVIWDIDEERGLLELPSLPDGLPLAFHPRERGIAHADSSGISLRSLPDGREIRRLPPGPRCRQMHFDPDGRRLAVLTTEPSSHVVRIHDAESGMLLHRLHHGGPAVHASWHPGGRLLATACQDFKIYIWESETGRRLRALEGHHAEVQHVTFGHTGAVLASTGWDNQTCIWDTLSWARLVTATGTGRAFSRDDRRIGFREGTRSLGTWRIEGGSEHRQLDVPGDSRVEKRPMDIAISPDGRWLAAEAGSRGVRVWSLGSPEKWIDLDTGWAEAVRFDPGGGSVLTSGAAGLLRWPIREEGSRFTFGPPAPLGIHSRRFSLEGAGRTLAAIRGDRVSVYSLDDRRELASLEHPRVHRVELSPSGRWAATSTWGGSGVRLWEARTGELAVEFPARSAHARFSPNERWVVIGAESGFTVAETGSWTVRRRLARQSGGDMPGTSAFTADSRLLALVLSAGSVHLFDPVSWEEVAQLPPLGPAYGGWMEFSASGALLAMASPTLRAVKLWDVAAIRRQLRGFGLDWEESLPREERQPILGLDVDPGKPRSGASGGGRPRALDLALVDVASGWLELDPDGETLARRAALHRRLGAREEALADLDALIALERDRLARGGSAGWRERLLASLRSRADLLADMGRIEEAIADHAAALAVEPGDLESRLHAARLLSAARG